MSKAASEWVDIRGGRTTLGLTGDEVERLAFASARAARERLTREPDALHGLRAQQELDERDGNPDALRRLIAAAFPAREVELPDYRIARAPVTNRDWARFVAERKIAPPEGWGVPGGDAPDRAVIGVSWEEAEQYAAWAGAALPTEAQWERAARGVERRLLPWGDAWGDQGGWIDAQPYYQPWRSGEHPELASPDGVLDLITRRWEWCADRFAPEGADLEVLATLFPALRADGCVRRGGQGPILIACAVARTGTRPTWRADGTGFRLARPL